ncbi:peptidoglycan editing factor PgeF [Meridianimarinicoccus sp. MJW13]|uniref:peptidoglycan editing factor PgeF n=1 Tax=Meridianimarinicoccus sp. MJW13 TaxID=2720031 RepID=UPI0018686225|nr:peptidoglycan editing factor PgeF [Fluviibacterium sp. MJW13]
MTLEILTSDALSSVKHGFFTRRGGASSGVFNGLNCGLGSSDQADAVDINRARVARAMDAQPGTMWRVHQIHSANVVIAEGDPPARAEAADAIVTREPGRVLSILTADCAPVLFFDPDAGVIGAAHAGWRGALAGILEATLDAMATLGAQPTNTIAVIGPTISQHAYEVGPEFMDDFIAEDPDNTRFFANGDGDRYMFDLPAYELHRLRRAGVAQAEWIRHCTYSDPRRFFSYRRSVHEKQADYGRLISTITL